MNWNEVKEFYLKYQKIILTSFCLQILSAFFINGYLHPDEHFQILEFLNYKLERTPLEVLPWEFKAQMRPWVQVFLYYMPASLLDSLNIFNPYFFETILRLFSVIIACFAQLILSFAIFKKFKDIDIKIIVLLSSFIWFLPFIHTRISSEAFGGSIFAIAISLYLINGLNRKFLFFIGLLLGLSFEIRYHIGFMILGFLSYLLIIEKRRLIDLSFIIGGILSSILFGAIINYWGYGNFNLPAIEYVYQNIFLGKAKNYGVSPWWTYIKDIIKKSIAPYGLIIVVSYSFFWIKHKKHLFTWVTLPFFVAHLLVSHKEWRFLIPMIPFIPFIISNFIQKDYFQKNFIKKTLRFLFFINCFIFVLICFKPSEKSVNFYQFAYKNIEPANRVLYLSERHPYNLAGLPVHYYQKPKGVQITKITSTRDILPSSYVYASSGEQYNRLKEINSCELRYSTYPEWALSLNIGNWVSRSKYITLFWCD